MVGLLFSQFAEQMEAMQLSPEQIEKKEMLDKKVKQLRLRMMTMMAAKQGALNATAGGDDEDGDVADVVGGEP